MTTAAPPPGFYDDPHEPGKKRWWDGKAWTDVTESSGLASKIPDLGTLAGGALVADGIVGFGKDRQGILGSLFGVIFGIAFALGISLFFIPQWNASNTIENPIDTRATVVSVSGVTTEEENDSGDTTVSTAGCRVVIEFVTTDGEVVQTGTTFSSSALCAYRPGQEVAISYDRDNVSRFQGLDDTGDTLMTWFPWIFVGMGILIAISSLWTFLLRATQIGGGIYLINRSRQKDKERRALKAAKRDTLPPPPTA